MRRIKFMTAVTYFLALSSLALNIKKRVADQLKFHYNLSAPNNCLE